MNDLKLGNKFVSKFIYYSFLASFIIYCLIGIKQFGSLTEFTAVYVLNLFYLIVYYTTCLYFSYNKHSKLSSVLTATFIISTIFVTFNLISFYTYSGSIFEYTGSDSTSYDSFAKYVNEYGIQNWIDYSKYSFDDAGFVLYLSWIYQVIEDPIFVRYLNVLINLYTTAILFFIAKRFLTDHLAIVSVIIYSIASYTVYYQSSGLKEVLMIAVIVTSYFLYYRFKDNPGFQRFIVFGLCTSLLLFFRIPLFLFVFLSIVPSEFMKSKYRKAKYLIVFIVVLITSFVLFEYSEMILRYYTVINAVGGEIEVKPNFFSRSIAILAGLFGPFPSIIPDISNLDTVMHGPGLTLKVILGVPFILSSYMIIKEKNYDILPIFLFVLFQIIALSLLVHTFKMRNQFPHMAFYSIVSLLMFMENKEHLIKTLTLRFYIQYGFLAMLFLMIFWNILRN